MMIILKTIKSICKDMPKVIPNEILDLFKNEQDTIQEVKKVFTKEFSSSKLNSGRTSADSRIKSANNR